MDNNDQQPPAPEDLVGNLRLLLGRRSAVLKQVTAGTCSQPQARVRENLRHINAHIAGLAERMVEALEQAVCTYCGTITKKTEIYEHIAICDKHPLGPQKDPEGLALEVMVLRGERDRAIQTAARLNRRAQYLDGIVAKADEGSRTDLARQNADLRRQCQHLKRHLRILVSHGKKRAESEPREVLENVEELPGWICPFCGPVPGKEVTHDEKHENCGCVVFAADDGAGPWLVSELRALTARAQDAEKQVERLRAEDEAGKALFVRRETEHFQELRQLRAEIERWREAFGGWRDRAYALDGKLTSQIFAIRERVEKLPRYGWFRDGLGKDDDGLVVERSEVLSALEPVIKDSLTTAQPSENPGEMDGAAADGEVERLRAQLFEARAVQAGYEQFHAEIRDVKRVLMAWRGWKAQQGAPADAVLAAVERLAACELVVDVVRELQEMIPLMQGDEIDQRIRRSRFMEKEAQLWKMSLPPARQSEDKAEP